MFDNIIFYWSPWSFVLGTNRLVVAQNCAKLPGFPFFFFFFIIVVIKVCSCVVVSDGVPRSHVGEKTYFCVEGSG